MLKTYLFRNAYMNAQVTFSFRTFPANGSLRIDINDSFDGTPIGTLTKVVEGVKPDEEWIIVKDYSENEGCMEWLIKEGIVTLPKLINGSPGLYLCKLTKTKEEIMYGRKTLE